MLVANVSQQCAQQRQAVHTVDDVVVVAAVNLGRERHRIASPLGIGARSIQMRCIDDVNEATLVLTELVRVDGIAVQRRASGVTEHKTEPIAPSHNDINDNPAVRRHCG
jgi:hypothetical protein